MPRLGGEIDMTRIISLTTRVGGGSPAALGLGSVRNEMNEKELDKAILNMRRRATAAELRNKLCKYGLLIGLTVSLLIWVCGGLVIWYYVK